jgi:hypothetical protein
MPAPNQMHWCRRFKHQSEAYLCDSLVDSKPPDQHCENRQTLIAFFGGFPMPAVLKRARNLFFFSGATVMLLLGLSMWAHP